MFCISIFPELAAAVIRIVKRFIAWLRFRATLPRIIEHARRHALKMLVDPDDADDAVAQVLFRIQRLPFCRLVRPQSYLLRAVHNAALDILRRRKRRLARCVDIAAVADELEDHHSPSLAEQLAGVQLAARVRTALASLKPIERSAVRFHYFQSLSIPETAERLGVDRYTAQNVLARARRELGRILPPMLLS
jgi:RNA polymerase sigma factor (sigma-70 family)